MPPGQHKEGYGLWTTPPHIENWIECVKARKQPNAPIEVAHRSTTVSHLVQICRELGRRLQWSPEKETFVGDDEANALISRERRKGYELPEVG